MLCAEIINEMLEYERITGIFDSYSFLHELKADKFN